MVRDGVEHNSNNGSNRNFGGILGDKLVLIAVLGEKTFVSFLHIIEQWILLVEDQDDFVYYLTTVLLLLLSS